MSDINRYKTYLSRHQWVIDKQAEGLTHADSMLQPPFRSNCFNWNLGHILVYRLQNIGRLDGETSYDDEEFKIYGGGSEPLTDPNMAVPVDELLRRLKDASEVFVTVLDGLTEADMAKVIDEERGTTVADRLDFHMFHEALHLGELGVLRQLAGTDDKVI